MLEGFAEKLFNTVHVVYSTQRRTVVDHVNQLEKLTFAVK